MFILKCFDCICIAHIESNAVFLINHQIKILLYPVSLFAQNASYETILCAAIHMREFCQI